MALVKYIIICLNQCVNIAQNNWFKKEQTSESVSLALSVALSWGVWATVCSGFCDIWSDACKLGRAGVPGNISGNCKNSSSPSSEIYQNDQKTFLK